MNRLLEDAGRSAAAKFQQTRNATRSVIVDDEEAPRTRRDARGTTSGGGRPPVPDGLLVDAVVGASSIGQSRSLMRVHRRRLAEARET